MSKPQVIQNLTEANALQYELSIMRHAKQVVDHFMPTPGAYPPAKQVANAVVAIQQLMVLVHAQQRVVIDSEAALQPTIDKLADAFDRANEAEKRVIALEQMRDEAEKKYDDLCVNLAYSEQAEYNSMQE